MNDKSIQLPSQLIEGGDLELLLSTQRPVILDTGRTLDEYEQSHIPGSLFIPRHEYWGNPDDGHVPFPGVRTISQWLENLGIHLTTPVILVDSGDSLWASRVAWTLAYLGHQNWAVLNGGMNLWLYEKRPSEKGEMPSPRPLPPGSLEPKIKKHLLINGEGVYNALSQEGVVILDTRSPGEYQGTSIYAERGGHIPHSIHLEWTINIRHQSPVQFRPIHEISHIYQAQGILPSHRIITLCQAGVRAAHTWLALTLAGYRNVTLYDGSWVEWAANSQYPTEVSS